MGLVSKLVGGGERKNGPLLIETLEANYRKKDLAVSCAKNIADLAKLLPKC